MEKTLEKLNYYELELLRDKELANKIHKEISFENLTAFSMQTYITADSGNYLQYFYRFKKNKNNI